MLTWVEVSTKAIRYNLKQFRRLIGTNTLLMPVVKANAYGHDFLAVAKICDHSREVDRICVADLNEALLLIKAKIKKPIMILSFYEWNKKNLTEAIKRGVMFPLYLYKQAEILNRIGERVGKKVTVHLKIDTGASRLGILPSEAENFLNSIKKLKFLRLEGIFSHFAASEEDKIYTEHQIGTFRAVVAKLEKSGYHFAVKHMACSAASVLYRPSTMNAVRLGLSLYGLYPDELSRKKIKLKPALSWYTTVAQVKTVPAWTKIGYGGTFTTKKTTKLAVLTVGYYDGYDRGLSNRAEVIIAGRRCPVRGRICMNMCMVDVSAVKNVKAGDKAVLIGKTGRMQVSADDLAHWAQSINYEIIDRINPNLERLII